MARSATSRTVWAAVIGNLLVAGTKFAAALFTGSSSMLSEAFHSFVDTGNEGLLLYGLRRSQRPPDAEHPHPHAVEHPIVIYTVLGLSVHFERASWLVALRGFRPSVGNKSYWAAIRECKDPPQFVVLLEDTAALIGIVIVFAGTWASIHWDEPRIDGIASIAVGVLLGLVSALLARESKGLLIGERADMKLQEQVFKIARRTIGVIRPNGLASAQLAPDQVVVSLSVQFEADLTTAEIEKAVV